MCAKCVSFNEALRQINDYKNALIAEHYFALAITASRTEQFLQECLAQHQVQDIHKDLTIANRLHA